VGAIALRICDIRLYVTLLTSKEYVLFVHELALLSVGFGISSIVMGKLLKYKPRFWGLSTGRKPLMQTLGVSEKKPIMGVRDLAYPRESGWSQVRDSPS
jgi:hypothetical protein